MPGVDRSQQTFTLSPDLTKLGENWSYYLQNLDKTRDNCFFQTSRKMKFNKKKRLLSKNFIWISQPASLPSIPRNFFILISEKKIAWIKSKIDHRYVCDMYRYSYQNGLNILYGRFTKTGLKIRIVQVVKTMMTMSSQKSNNVSPSLTKIAFSAPTLNEGQLNSCKESILSQPSQ